MWESHHLIEELAHDRITERTSPTRRFPRAGRPARALSTKRRADQLQLG